MTTADANTVAQLGAQLQLVTDDQVRECWDELEAAARTPEAFLKILERKGYLTPWQSHKLLKGDTDGYFLGGYRVLYKIASGSFGRVFRADDPRTGAGRRHQGSAQALERGPAQGRTVRARRPGGHVDAPSEHRPHPGRQPGQGDRPVLHRHGVRRGRQPPRLPGHPQEARTSRKRCVLLEECSSALAYAFTRGLTHRDIKLTNILIASQGVAKLVDFGLAEIAAPEQGEDHDVAVDRTVDYAGLEKATAVKHGDIRSDIYFLGCVFYEMLCRPRRR